MSSEFRPTAPSAETVFYRSYSRRKVDGSRESFEEAMNRAIDGIAEVGKLGKKDTELIRKQALEQHAFPSGRAFWVAGSQWSKDPSNFYGYYNCSSVHIQDLRAFGLLMDMAMQGTGTGAVLEQDTIAKLPVVRNRIEIIEVVPLGDKGGNPVTSVLDKGDHCVLQVGDSRQGWVDAYQGMINSAFSEEQFEGDTIRVVLDLSQVRPAGERLKGFGGTANPIKLEEMFRKVAALLSSCYGRKLSSVEACLLIDEAAACVVAGNIRRCLPKDALVHTERGLVPIKDVTVGDKVQTSKGLRAVVDKFEQGKQVIYEITTQDGSFFCSKNHKVAVLRDIYGRYEMVKAIDLAPEDRMVGNHFTTTGTKTSLPEPALLHSNGNKSLKPLLLPELDGEVAYFIGYLHGNGNVRKDGYSIRLSGPRGFEQLAYRCANVLKSFGFESHLYHKKDTKAWELSANGKALNAYLGNFKKVCSDPVIPECILQGEEDIRWHYLAGLMDSDGTPSTHVLLSSSSGTFCRQVQVLYSSLGVPTRMQSYDRKGQKREHELNAVGLHKQKIHEIFSRIGTRYPVLSTTPTPSSRCQHGFPREMVKMAVKGLSWGQLEKQKVCSTVASIEPATTELIPISVVSVSATDRFEETYDIEVDEIHEFYCDGYLVSNSAGMRQGSSTDQEFIHAKEGLYTQDEEGNWKVDPTKEALRMANHTVCYHTKPTLEEVRASVQKQFFSGEGAIQYVPEAIARANVDLLPSPAAKDKFIRVYENQGKQAAKQYLQLQAQLQDQELDERELEHRITRYGLNPCLTPETQVMTRSGYAQIKDLVGKTVEIYDGQEWRTIDNFRVTGYDQDVYDVELHDGSIITATAYHTFILEDGTRKELRELEIGDTLKIANIPAVSGTVAAKGGYLKGFLIGDGTSDKGQGAICKVYAPKAMCVERLVRAQEEIGTSSNKKEPGLTPAGYLRNLGVMSEDMNPWCHRHKQEFPYETLNWTTAAKAEFLAGLFDADGTAMDTKNGYAYQITSVSRPFLEGLLTLLRTLGIYGKIGPARDKGYQDFGPERGGVCRVKPTYRVTIAQAASVKLAQLCDFERLKSFADRMSKYNIHPKNNRVKSVTFSHTAPEVYCCTVEGSHAFTLANQIVIGQCAEVVMRDNLCVAGDTPLLLKDRIARIRDVVGQKVKVWNGSRFSEVRPYQTGEAVRLYRVTFNDGSYLDTTDQHKFWVKDRFQRKYHEVATIDLQELIKTSRYGIYTEDFEIKGATGAEVDSMDMYTLGVLVGDGTIENNGTSLGLTLYGEKANLPVKANRISGPTTREGYNVECVTCRGFDGISAEQVIALKNDANALLALGSLSRTATLEFVAGLADTDGSDTTANGIRIYLSRYDRAEALYLLLLRHGIKSSINFAGLAGDRTNMGVRSEDLCYLQITDCADIPCRRLDTSKGRKPEHKGKHQIVKSVELLPGLHPTFCFTEPEHHKGVFKGTLTGQCNLAEVHLNTIKPQDTQAQYDAFYAAGIQVAALLKHKFVHERIQYSREIDPIVGVSFTGLFDFFVTAFGTNWLEWMFNDRPEGAIYRFEERERQYLEAWKQAAYDGVKYYCDKHKVRMPNRWTVVQPAGSKSLLTGASSGWHPPYAQRFIRRITLGVQDPLVSALRDWGYSLVPAPSARDDEGNLLNDIGDPRVREVLVEIPTEVPWANLPGADSYDLNQLSAVAQMRLYMNVQRYYTTHTTSATISFRENEIDALAQEIYGAIGTGYIGVALLARFDANATFPRLPMEPISKERYQELMEAVKAWRLPEDEELGFLGVLAKYDRADYELVTEAACTSAACIARAEKDEQEGKA